MQKISVIVPVYNVKVYLERCINTLLKQTYREIEIILVDDGSTDGSGEVLDFFAEKDERIKVVHQCNGGVAKARKKGAKCATGEFIAFVDADDYIDDTFLEQMVKEIGEADLLTAGYYEEKGLDKEIKKNKKVFDIIPSGIYASEIDKNYILKNMIYYEHTNARGFTPFIWNKLYKTNLAQVIFEEIDDTVNFAEDSEFLYRYVFKSNIIKISNICGYHYVERDGSAVRTLKKDFFYNIIKLYDSLKTDFQNHHLKKELMWQLEMWLIDLLYSVPRSLGFENIPKPLRYIFPFFNEIEGCKMVLYGAGTVGGNYYKQLINYPKIKLQLWVDKKVSENPAIASIVKLPTDIIDVEYDYIVVAVLKEHLYLEIKQELIELGIDESKILWKAPIVIN